LDHFFVKQKDLKRVRNAGIWAHGIDSDHRAITMRLAIAHTVSGPPLPARRVDRTMLYNSETRKEYRAAIKEYVELLRGSITSNGAKATPLQVLEKAMVAAAKATLMTDGRKRPG